MNGKGPDIPRFRDDGYLPEGLYLATEAEAIFRFGSPTRIRRHLVLRERRWLGLARDVGASRFLIDGGFVTAKLEPNDVDAVVFLPTDFDARIEAGDDAAVELEEMLMSRLPQEIFAAEDEADWYDWIEFFSRTRESDGRRKGLVEIEL